MGKPSTYLPVLVVATPPAQDKVVIRKTSASEIEAWKKMKAKVTPILTHERKVSTKKKTDVDFVSASERVVRTKWYIANMTC